MRFPAPSSLSRPVSLPRPDGSSVVLQLQPLSLGFQRRLRERGIVSPVPPVRVARDSSGKPVRDDSGLAVTMADRHDSDYLLQNELYHQRVAVLAIAESLRSDPDFGFETPAPAEGPAGAWPRYADALFAEMETAGLTAGDLVFLCDAVCRLSNLADQQFEQAQHGFFSPAAAPAIPPPS